MSGLGAAVLVGILALVLVAVLPGLAHAQAYKRIAPHVPVPGPTPAVPLPAQKPAPPASTKPIIPELKGLLFVPGESALKPSGVAVSAVGVSGIRTTGLELLSQPAFHDKLAPFLHHPVSFASLNAIERLTSRWYQEHGHPFVDVTVPPQNVASGVVQVVVTEYRIGKVDATGNRWFSSALLKRESGLRHGDVLTLGGVRSALGMLNSNPFRSVNTILHPGASTGLSNVELRTQDRLPVRIYGIYDNQGVPSLGRGEWGVGGTWGNVAGLDQVLSYQYTRGLTGRYKAHALSWTIPLPWRDRLLVFGSYAIERPALNQFFNETGRSAQASFRYVHDLPYLQLWHGVGLREDMQVGFDFKTTNNNIEFGGLQVFASTAQIDQFPLIYEATETDPWGQTAFSNQLVLSPGGITHDNSNAAFARIEPGARTDYAYDTIGLSRTTKLPAGFTWTARVEGQVSNRNLLYSEQLGLGGMNSVRGYYTDTALGSEGVLVSQEIRGLAFSLMRLAGLHTPVADLEQLGVFWDYGHVAQVTPVPHEVNEADLSSVGVDLHSRVGRFVNLSFDVGWRLCPAPGTDKRGAFGDVALLVGY